MKDRVRVGGEGRRPNLWAISLGEEGAQSHLWRRIRKVGLKHLEYLWVGKVRVRHGVGLKGVLGGFVRPRRSRSRTPVWGTY